MSFLVKIKKWPVWGKIVLALLVLITPMVVIILIFRPLVQERATFNSDQRYKLSADFSAADIDRIVEVMRQDIEFSFYFRTLSPVSQQRSIAHFFTETKQTRKQHELFEYLRAKQKKVETLAILINTLQFPDNYSQSPEQFPELGNALLTLVSVEFELTMGGLSYKVLYDPAFQFHWSPATRKAARQLVQVFSQLSLSQRSRLQEIYDAQAVEVSP